MNMFKSMEYAVTELLREQGIAFDLHSGTEETYFYIPYKDKKGNDAEIGITIFDVDDIYRLHTQTYGKPDKNHKYVKRPQTVLNYILKHTK